MRVYAYEGSLRCFVTDATVDADVFETWRRTGLAGTMTSAFTIMIPVFNETKAIEFSSYYFRSLGIEVKYVLDSQHAPESRRTLCDLGHDICIFENDRPFIESGYASFASCSPTDWILRLDCDEVASTELIEVCHAFVTQDPHAVAGFDRYQLVWQGEHFLAATTERYLPANQRQYRLFNRKHVRFITDIHSAGIRFDRPAPLGVGGGALYHLSWIFLSWEDRIAKSARYDQHGQTADTQLEIMLPLDQAEFQALDAPTLRDAYADWLEVANRRGTATDRSSADRGPDRITRRDIPLCAEGADLPCAEGADLPCAEGADLPCAEGADLPCAEGADLHGLALRPTRT